MWLRKGADVTSNSEVQYPSPKWRQGQEGVNLTDTKYGGWIRDGTDSAMVGLRPPEAREPEVRWAGM